MLFKVNKFFIVLMALSSALLLVMTQISSQMFLFIVVYHSPISPIFETNENP
jgi:hypothetical protein